MMYAIAKQNPIKPDQPRAPRDCDSKIQIATWDARMRYYLSNSDTANKQMPCHCPLISYGHARHGNSVTSLRKHLGLAASIVVIIDSPPPVSLLGRRDTTGRKGTLEILRASTGALKRDQSSRMGASSQLASVSQYTITPLWKVIGVLDDPV